MITERFIDFKILNTVADDRENKKGEEKKEGNHIPNFTLLPSLPPSIFSFQALTTQMSLTETT